MKRLKKYILLPLLGFFLMLIILAVWVFIRSLTFVDCFWDSNVEVWLDENENGTKDPEEVPLVGVNILLNDHIHSTTDWKGEARPSLFLGGCPYVEITISAEERQDYKLTTVSFFETNSDESPSIQFGYAPLPGAPTLPPRPPNLECRKYESQDFPPLGTIQVIKIHPDKTVWFGGVSGTARFNPSDESWELIQSADGSPSNIQDITIAPNGDIWLASYHGRLIQYRDEILRTEFLGNQFPDHKVRDIEFSDDGTLWIATDQGVVSWNLELDEWVKYTEEDGLSGNFVTALEIDHTGTIWTQSISINNEISFLPSDSNDKNPPKWQTIGHLKDQNGEWFSGIISSLLVTDDGTLWAGMTGFKNPEDDFWQQAGYPYYVNDFHISPNGSAWVATSNHLAFVPHPLKRDITTTRLFDSREGLIEPNAIAVEDKSVIWVGEKASGVSRCLIPEGFYNE